MRAVIAVTTLLLSSLIGVRLPGETVLTRTPAGPNSAAQLRASWISAAFVAE